MKSNTPALNPVSSAIAGFAVLSPCHAHAATPAPKVTGPIPVAATSYPFGAADHAMLPQNLKSREYIEEEFLISVAANVYDWPGPGPAACVRLLSTFQRLFGRALPLESRFVLSPDMKSRLTRLDCSNNYRDHKTYERKVIDNLEELVKVKMD